MEKITLERTGVKKAGIPVHNRLYIIYYKNMKHNLGKHHNIRLPDQSNVRRKVFSCSLRWLSHILDTSSTLLCRRTEFWSIH